MLNAHRPDLSNLPKRQRERLCSLLSRKKPKDKLEDTPREVEREKEREITAAEIGLAHIYGEAVIGGQTAEVCWRAMVIVRRKTLVPDGRRENRKVSRRLELLRMV